MGGLPKEKKLQRRTGEYVSTMIKYLINTVRPTGLHYVWSFEQPKSKKANGIVLAIIH